MSEQKEPNLDSIFAAAVEIQDDEERAAFLEDQCGPDEKLRAELEQLLRSHRESGSFMDRPAAGLDKTIDVNRDVMEAGLSRAFTPSSAVVIGDGGHSVLKSLGKQLKSVPRVTLRDTGGDHRIVKPKSQELPDKDWESRYHLDGEIARGGMGAIIKGRDTDLGRDLAIKVLLDSHKDKPEVVERFVEEAQIGGQLQHPGIVPVYELGQFSDERPFFSMKLVKGKTLATLLTERDTPADDQAQLLGIFEQVCKTMAYAHTRGVIHRDLKPANIMVGAFGEVQVMDWGLAKVLGDGGVADEKRSLDKHKDVSIIRTLRTGSDTPEAVGSQTNMGSVMGTPAYMPPEQALGEIDRLDERADVFGLGAVLCEILTGKPPYVGEDSRQVFRQASRGQLEECWNRLDASGADEELLAVAKRATAPQPEDRFRNASALANAVSTYLNGVQERLKQAEIAKSQAQARAEEEGRRRQLNRVITAMTVIMAIGTGVVALHFWQQRNAQAILTQKANLATQSAKQARNDAQQKSERLAEQLQISTINRLAAESASLRKTAPVLSTLVAMEAVDLSQQDGRASSIALESLMNATSRLGGRAHYAHHAPIQVISVSSGRLAASGDSEGRVCLWDVYADNPMETVRSLEGHRATITRIKFTPNSRWLVTASEDGDVRRWDLHASEPVGQELSGHTELIRAVDIGEDGRWLMTASHDRTVRLWDLEQADPNLTARELVHQGKLGSAHFILDDRWIVTGDWGESPNHWRFWNLQDLLETTSGTAKPRFAFPGGQGVRLYNVHGVSRNGRFLLNDSGIWQLHEDGMPKRLESFDEAYEERRGFRMRFLDNDQLLLIAQKGGKRVLWEWSGDQLGNKLREFDSSWIPWGYLQTSGFSPDGKWMLDRSTLVDLEDESKPAIWIGDSKEGHTHSFTTDSRRLLAADGDGGLRIWNLDDDLFASPIINHGFGKTGQLELGPTGQWLAVGNNLTGYLARLDSGRFTNVIEFPGSGSNLWGRAFSPDGKWFAAGSKSGNSNVVLLYDLSTEGPNSAPIMLTGFESNVSSIAFAPDSRSLATGGQRGGSIRLWDISSGDAIRIQDSEELLLPASEEREMHDGCLTISPNGRWLASGDSQSMIRLWDLHDPAHSATSWNRIPLVAGGLHDEWISSVRFTPDVAWLVTVGPDDNLQLWKFNEEGPEGEPPVPVTRQIPGAGEWPKTMFSPNGRSMFFHQGRGVVQRWVLSEMGLSESPALFGTPSKGSFVDPTISPDGHWLFTGVNDQLHRWDLSADDPTQESVVLRCEDVRRMVISGDGRYLITTDPKRLQLWPLDTEELLRIARERTGRGFSKAERRRYLE